MRALLVGAVAVTMFLVSGTRGLAQVALKPGELVAASALGESLPERATSAPARITVVTGMTSAEDRHERKANRVWVASMLALVAASGFDAGTSWGKQETNGLLASSDGTFGARGMGIKAGTAAAILIPQILFRKNKGLRAKFTIGNFAGSAVFTGVAIHNVGIPAAK